MVESEMKWLMAVATKHAWVSNVRGFIDQPWPWRAKQCYLFVQGTDNQVWCVRTPREFVYLVQYYAALPS